MSFSHKDSARRDWGLALAVALSLPACWPLLRNGFLINTRQAGDSPFLLVRLFELCQNLHQGDFPARWMPNAAYGMGYPFFNFYASLPYYLAALFHLLGFGYIWAVKLTQVLGFTLAAATMYLYSRDVLGDKSRALLAAVAYTYAPFHLVNVYTRGDSLSEFYAFIFYPLLLWGLRALRAAPAKVQVAGVGMSYAALILTHNISALLFTPLAAVYAIVLAGESRQGRVRYLGLAGLALALGLGLSAWFWMPALLEGKFVRLEVLTTGYFHYANHFRGLNLVQRSLAFNYGAGPGENPFAMGLVQALLILGALLALPLLLGQRDVERRSLALAAAILALTTFLITPLSRPVWARVPLLPFVQFPWRMLSIQAFAGSLLIGALATFPRWRLPRQAFLAGLLVSALLPVLVKLKPEYLYVYERELTGERLALYEYFTANIGTTVKAEYLPRWVEPRPFTPHSLLSGTAGPKPMALEGTVGEMQLRAKGATSQHWQVEVLTPQATLAFPTYYFPGWQAQLDGRPWPVEPVQGLGYIGLRLPNGKHELGLRLGRSRVRFLAEALSALSLGIWSLLSFRRLKVGRRAWVSVALGAAGLGIAATLARLPNPQPPPLPWSDLSLDAHAPLPHHSPNGIRFGREGRLRGYTLSTSEVAPGQALTITLHWGPPPQEASEAELSLVPQAGFVFEEAEALASSRAPLHGSETSLVLKVPERTNPGPYLLRLSVEGLEGPVKRLGERGQELDLVYLGPVKMGRAPQALPTAEPKPLRELGQGIELLEASAVQEGGTLLVESSFRTTKSLLLNYVLSIRLKHPTGQTLSIKDSQPNHGLFPTTLWQLGEVVYDRRRLELPPGTPPGNDYILEIVIYEAPSLRPISAASLPGLQIARPTISPEAPVLHSFCGGLALSAFAPTGAKQGEKLGLQVLWKAVETPTREYKVAIELRDTRGATLHHQEEPLSPSYPPPRWPKDALVLSWHQVPIAKDLAPGEYRLNLTLVERETGRPCGEAYIGPSLAILAQERSFLIPPMGQKAGAEFGGELRLLGYDLARKGKALHITLHWQAIADPSQDYTIFVHLFNPQTEAIAVQRDAMPLEGRYPTSRWKGGEVVSDSFTLTPEGVPPGSYLLAVGLYERKSMVRLRASAPPPLVVSADRLVLEEMAID